MLVKDRVWKILYLAVWSLFTIATMIKNSLDGPLAYQILIWLGALINLKFLVSIVKDYINAEEA